MIVLSHFLCSKSNKILSGPFFKGHNNYHFNGSLMHVFDNVPKHTTPSPVYPSLHVQVLSPADTFVHTAFSEHPPLDQAHRSSSAQERSTKQNLSVLPALTTQNVCKSRVKLLYVVCLTFAVRSIAFVPGHTHTCGRRAVWSA